MSERSERVSSGPARRPHVLVASDDTGLSAFLNEGLVIAGCWVSVVASGLQVLEVFRLRSFELALIDVALGGLGVSELVRRLRLVDEQTGAPRSDIPILLIGESSREVSLSEVALSAVDAVILAPIEIDELALTIFATVRRWRDAHPDRPWSDEAAQAPAQS